jgi:DNA-binding CsgD family transcriptional regulator
MTRKLETFLERLDTTNTVDDLSSLADILRDTYGVENMSYLATNLNGLPFVSSTYDPKWAQHYEEQNYMLIDPVVRGALLQFNPLDWKRLDWSTKRTREFFNEAVDFGVGRQGYTVPIRGPNGQAAIFAINHDSNDAGWERYIGEHAHDFMLISHYFHQKALAATHTAEPVEGRELSPRELDVLKYLGIGLSRGKVAEILKISEHTLRVYVDSARYKLGALNTTHAVAIALARGVIAV